ncbi:hypothetical protein N9134_00380 [Akkermansiaceae bacterium]|nr:hypothetical protein [bacterium]MDA7672409.1 hypothetical protein [Akkermansiaceae bacterium]MDA7933248.1 hypothetical protein [bacterium]MDB0068071.1 hypothetical protein [Akkermansiaceae bacterium]MDB4262205.1 hypothetical protein [Akkermansiaceae bacterium]
MKKSVAIIILLLATLKLGHHFWSDEKHDIPPERISKERGDAPNPRESDKENARTVEKLPVQEPQSTSSVPHKPASVKQRDLNEKKRALLISPKS